MSDRPEYVWCVLTGMFDRPEGHPKGARKEQKTWCGQDVTGFEFQDAGHASITARVGSRLLCCPECAKAISDTLLGHTWDGTFPPEEEDTAHE